MPSYTRSAIFPGYKHPPPGGYRKTRRKQSARRARHDMPPWVARFVVDGLMPFGLCTNQVEGIVGAALIAVGRCCVMGEIQGRNRDWVLRQIEALATKLGHDHRPLMVSITRKPEPVPTIARPFERGDPHVVALGHVRVIDGTAMRPWGM